MIPKVSIIVPCYNVEKYIDRCLHSLLNQTLNDIEIILIDDGSPDRIPEICDKYASQDKRVKVIHKENEGLGLARNSGIDIASGETIAFVDSDDYVDEDTYQKLYASMIKYDCDLVMSGRLNEIAPNKWVQEPESDHVIYLDRNGVEDYILNMVACLPYEKKDRLHEMSCWRALYRRDIIINNNIQFLSEREVVSEDVPFQISYFTKSHSMVLLPDCFYHYCLNGSSLTATYNKEKFYRYKVLRNILKERLQWSDTADQRVDRCFIGQVRKLIIKLLESTSTEKKQIIREYLNDPVWIELRNYKPIYLPIYQCIFHFLCIRKMPMILYYYAMLVLNIKKIGGRKV